MAHPWPRGNRDGGGEANAEEEVGRDCQGKGIGWRAEERWAWEVREGEEQAKQVPTAPAEGRGEPRTGMRSCRGRARVGMASQRGEECQKEQIMIVSVQERLV